MPGVNSGTEKMTNNKKRNSSQAAGEDGQEKPIKRRASTACQACRARKVRCNVLENGPPCTNCRLDDVQCTISIGKRRLGMSRGNAEAILLFSDHGPDSVESTYFSNHNYRRHDKSPQHMPHQGHRPSFPGLSRPSVDVTSYPETQYQFLETAFGPNRQTASPVHSHGSAEGHPGLGLGFTDLRSSPSRLMTQPIPSWIKPLPERISPDDMEFLARKGALSTHDETFRNELLKCFVRWVYPWSPVVNLDHVVKNFAGNNASTGKLSLLLFQAMMFAGAGFADLAILRSAGFNSRKEARKHFFHRCKLLYDFEYEDDRLVLIQALVLMTYWHDSADDQKDIWHWITVAVALAQTIGLNQDPDTLELTAPEKHLRKRVWWSLFMRDRLVALAMRRAAKVQMSECHVPALLVSDFDLYEGSVAGRVEFLKLDPMQRERFALLTIEICKLCEIIGRILETQYSTTCIRRRGSGGQEKPNTTTTMVLLPRKAQDDKIQVLALEAMLNAWIEGLPQEITYDNVRRTSHHNENFELKTHCAELSMLYHTAAIMLFRPSHLSHSSGGTRLEATQESRSAQDKTREAGSQITRIASELEVSNSVRYLLTVGVTIIVHAAMVQLFDAGSQDLSIRQSSLDNLAKNMRVLEQLCDVYIAADLAAHLLQTGITKAGIRLQASHRNTTSPPLCTIDEEQPERKQQQQQQHQLRVHTNGLNHTPPLMSEKSVETTCCSNEDVLVMSTTDEYAQPLWPNLTPPSHTDHIFGYDTAFPLDDPMSSDFSSFGFTHNTTSKEGVYFGDSDPLADSHWPLLTT